MKNYKKRIVLLHGWGSNIAKLEPLSVELKKQDWKVLVPQLPGFDAQEPFEVWGVDEYAEFVEAFAQKAFDKKDYFVFGHSFGGRVAIKLANKSPRVVGVILCATGGLSRANPVKRGIFFLLAKIGKIVLVAPGVLRFWQKILYKLAREHDYEKASPRMKSIFKKVIAEDLRSETRKIKTPLLVLWGGKDKMTPISDAYFIKGVLPKTKLITFEDNGHRLPYEKPKDIAASIQTWAKSLQ